MPAELPFLPAGSTDEPGRPQRIGGVFSTLPPPAPRWSLLALERRSSVRRRNAMWRRLVRVRALGVLVAFGLPVFALGGGTAALGFVCVCVATVALVARLPIVERLRAERERATRCLEAGRLREGLLPQLPRPQQEELDRLERLVEHVRIHEGGGVAAEPSPLVARLDALLVLFVNLSVELRSITSAFAVTQADAPEPPPPAAQIDPDARSERARSLKIAHLRTHARARCRARVQHLQAELASIGQLVRLVHEQTLARDVRHGELAKILTAVLEEAEVARQARDEVEAIVAEPVPIGLLSLPRAGQG